MSGTIGNGGLLVIAGKVNETSIRGVVDTGASHHAYDRKLVPFLDEFESNESNSSIEICGPQRMTIGSFGDVVKAGSAVVDLAPFSLRSEERIDAVIGMPFLIERAIHIYPSSQNFTIQETGTTGGNGIRIQFDEFSRPCVPITLAGKEVIALIDTGSNAEITVSEGEFERMLNRLATSQNLSTVNTQNLEGSTQRRKIANCDITIGHMSVPDVAIVESKSTKIGMAFLNRFTTVIDLLNMRLQLESLPSGQ